MLNHKKRVLVALSGGLDSAAVVMMLKESGDYQVHAMYLDFTGSDQWLIQAKAVADMLDVELSVLDVREEFEQSVIDYMLDSHHSGETPSPCAVCNPRIKWGAMCRIAQQKGFDYIATGHYVRLSQIDDVYVVERGVDPLKDQSYYLWGLTQQQLSMCILPLGGFTKLKVREYLESKGLPSLSKSSESMSLCFLNRGLGLKPYSYPEYLVHRLGSRIIAGGAVVDRKSGKRVGSHNGYQLYTIGQKRGFELDPQSAYVQAPAVVEIIARDNVLVVDQDASGSLYITKFVCRDLITNLAALMQIKQGEIEVVVRGLGRNPTSPAISIKINEELRTVEVELEAPGAWAMAKGQPVVFYFQNKVVAGAIFDHSL